jgi:hypothetical protein
MTGRNHGYVFVLLTLVVKLFKRRRMRQSVEMMALGTLDATAEGVRFDREVGEIEALLCLDGSADLERSDVLLRIQKTRAEYPRFMDIVEGESIPLGCTSSTLEMWERMVRFYELKRRGVLVRWDAAYIDGYFLEIRLGRLYDAAVSDGCIEIFGVP